MGAAREFVLERRQTFDRPVEEMFAFFADARNLARITPEWLGFVILTPGPIEMRAGTLIDYKIRLHGIPMRWQSVISVWEPPHRFVDEQRRGPYKFWVHEHAFGALEDGRTAVGDRVRYGVAGGVLVQRLFVESRLEKIFDYRARTLAEIFDGGDRRQR